MQLLPDTKYIIEEDLGDGESAEEQDIAQATEQASNEVWLDDEIKRLVVFYIDNKDTFLSGTTKKTHLWAVACKTMLAGKHPISCEVKLRQLKSKYAEACMYGGAVEFPYYDLCHRAFHDDSYVKMCLNDLNQINQVTMNLPVNNVVNQDGILVVKKVNTVQNRDEQVEAMLNSYIKHKAYFQKQYNSQKGIWEAIAMDLGEEDVDYWHKRFLNFKQHYIRMVCKRKESGAESINWPYIKYFDQIYGDDEEFIRKYLENDSNTVNGPTTTQENNDNSWLDVETTFLVKYYFDCFNEFLDRTIPNKFLWQEVGRLLDKSPESCEKKFNELKNEHFDQLIQSGYDLANRIPLAILFDNIIAREVEIEVKNSGNYTDEWKMEEIDELVQYLYENIDMLKDTVCYYVCWAVLARKLNRSITSCRKQWNGLTTLYKSILEDKKENPDMQIDWRYIDLFDRIFDYGMDSNLLDGYEKLKELNKASNEPSKVGGM